MKLKVKEMVSKFKTVAKSAQMKSCEVISQKSGASAVEIALAAVVAVVLICIIMNAFTGIFTNTIIPGIQNKISEIFATK